MSREVEVKNIQMTATVPEDIQISLGHLSITGVTNATNASGHGGLTDNEGILAAPDGGTADDGGVVTPSTGRTAYDMLDWSNSADISAYYKLGKIIPASSTTGEDIFFTPDAAGVGKTLKTDPMYYQAADGLTAIKEDVATTTEGVTTWSKHATNTYKTTLHAITNETEANDKWNTDPTDDDDKYVTATAWNVTNDDGYYVDIPVWLRTSSTTAPTLAVDAYVTTNKATDDDDLYLAARAVVIYEGAAANTTEGQPAYPATDPVTPTSTGLIEVRQDKWSETTSVVNFMSSTNASGEAVNELTGDVVRDAGKKAKYTTETHYNGGQLVHLNAGSGTEYSAPVKAIIRVWLEGEDPNCWNENAGQDFNISLKFTKEAVTPATYTPAFSNAASDADGSLIKGTRTTVTSTAGSNPTDTLVFEYDGVNWQLRDGTFHTYAGYTFKFGSTVVEDSDDIATALKALDNNTQLSTYEGVTTALTVTPNS